MRMSCTLSHKAFVLLIVCTYHCVPGRAAEITVMSSRPDTEVELTGIPYKLSRNIVFEVRGCETSLVTLWGDNNICYKLDTDPANNTITLGVCIAGACDFWDSVPSSGLDCLQSLWVRWEERKLEVGTGPNVGKRIALGVAPVGTFTIKTIMFSSDGEAEWKFASCCDASVSSTDVPETQSAPTVSMTTNDADAAPGNVSSPTFTTFIPPMSPLKSEGNEKTSQLSGFTFLVVTIYFLNW